MRNTAIRSKIQILGQMLPAAVIMLVYLIFFINNLLDRPAAKKKWGTLKNARSNPKRPKVSEKSAKRSDNGYLYASEISFLDKVSERSERSSSINAATISDSLFEEVPENEDFSYHCCNLVEQVEQQTKTESQTPKIPKTCKRPRQRPSVDAEEVVYSKFLSAIESIAAEPKVEETEGPLFGKLIGQHLDRLDPMKSARA